MSRRIQKNYILFGVALLVCLCFLAGSIFFVRFISLRNERQSLRYLTSATSQVRASVSQQISGDFQVLRGVAISLGEIGVEDRDTMRRILDQINESNTFVRMGFFEPDGTGSVVELGGKIYTDVDFSGYDFFALAMQGGETVTGIMEDPLTGEQVNYYAIPITQNGNTLGVLCAANRRQVLLNIINVTVFQGSGWYSIIDSTGQVVGPSPQTGAALTTGQDFFDVATFTATEQAKFQQALAGRTSITVTVDVGGEEQIAVVQSLGVNDWHLLSVTPHTAIDGYYNQSVLGATLVVLAACLIFAFLLLVQHRNQQKNRRALEHLAYTDLLTGASNYAKFQLDAAKRLKHHRGGACVLWSFDVKQFKRINDVLGYRSGDALLKEITYILEQDAAEDTLFCHISADQFAGLRSYGSREELEQWFLSLAEKMNDKQIQVASQMPVDISMGFYLLPGGKSKEPVIEMVNRATIAKQFAKEEVGSQFAFYGEEMAHSVRRETLLEAAAITALEKGEFTFHLQPKINIQHGNRLSGAEALARWTNPELGSISPAEFVPLFERNGFVIQLDRFIFESACRWYRDYMDAGNPPMHLAINISRHSFLQEDFIEYYTAIKQKYSIPDGALELELTENVILFDYKSHAKVVQKLNEKGFLCSIDDFGSGYSSLNVLKNLPVQVIKLDAVFFRDGINVEREKIVIASFIHMAQDLNILTVAEGVETPEQVEFLRGTGCDIVQGYVFSKPLPPENFVQFAQNIGSIPVPV